MCREIQKSKCSKTLEAFFMLQMNLSFLKTGIFKNAEDENYYSMNVLLRSLIVSNLVRNFVSEKSHKSIMLR